MVIPPAKILDRVDDFFVRLFLRPDARDEIEMRYCAHVDIMKAAHPLILSLLRDDDHGAEARDCAMQWLAARSPTSRKSLGYRHD